MDFEPTAEQEELRASVRSALERESPVSLAREVVEQAIRAEEPWSTAGKLGWTAVTIPEAAGGLGLGPIELALMCEEHGHALAPGPFLATVGMFVPVVREAAAPDAHERLLGGVAEGTATGALACSNLAGGFRAPDAALTATRDGTDYVLHGSRHWVLSGAEALHILVAAQVDFGDGLGLFAVPRASLALESVAPLDATRSLCAIEAKSLRVAPEHTVGEPGACLAAFHRALSEATVALAMEMVGSSQALFERTLEHARQREQFGQPIGAFQAVQHKLADCFIELEKARSTGLFAAMTLAEHDSRAPLAASMAKVAAGECQRRVAKEAIQIHGGLGFTWEQDVHLFVKRIQTGERLLGTSAFHRRRIADLLEI